jgi:hypothetical protein
VTEYEWLTGDDPTPMMEFLREEERSRKLRLFAVACCRQVERRLAAASAARLLDLAESEGGLSRSLSRAIEEFFRDPMVAVMGNLSEAIDGAIHADPYEAARGALNALVWFEEDQLGDPGRERHARLVREIFGNPFRAVTFVPEWRTSTAVALAQQMYEARDFSAMPILADALQDAGCDNDDILNHCRDAGVTHVRGCWVVDLVLGKE